MLRLRGNIGNARLAGLEEDLNMTGDQYNVALTIFFVSYIFFEIPANMALKRFSPKVWSTSTRLTCRPPVLLAPSGPAELTTPPQYPSSPSPGASS